MIKKILLYTILFAIINLASQAQNYSPFASGNTSLFSDINNQVQALHIDSMTTDPKGTVYHFLKTWRIPSDLSCLPYDQAMWAGSKCIINGDTYLFFNETLDTLYFNPTKELNQSWIFYKYANGQYLEATVTNKQQESFIGLTDSVKTISLQAKDSGGNNVSNALNNYYIKVSKQYGITSCFNLNDIPSESGPLTLIGLTSPQAGIQLLSPRIIYDYAIGDIFHYEEAHSNPPNGEGFFIKKICTVIGKRVSINTDTVIYNIQRITDTTITDWQTNETRYSYTNTDTVEETHILNAPMHYPSQAIIITDSSQFMERKPYPQYDLSISSDYNNRLVASPSYHYPHYNGNNCWTDLQFYPVSIYTFSSGLGQVEYNGNFYGGAAQEQDYDRLVYFKKGSETWGTPVVLSNYSKDINTVLTIFPNPLKQGEQLNIQSENFQVQQILVYNNLGTKVLSYDITQSNIKSVDLSPLQPGIYVIQLINADKEFTSSKLIIK